MYIADAVALDAPIAPVVAVAAMAVATMAVAAAPVAAAVVELGSS